MNPIDGFASIYEKWFLGNPSIGYLVIVIIISMAVLPLWLLGIDKYKKEHPPINFSLFIDCQLQPLPIAVSQNSTLYILEAFPGLIGGGLTQYLFGPDAPTSRWPSADKSLDFVCRCDVKNLGEHSIFNIELPIDLAFLAWIEGENGQQHAQAGIGELLRTRIVEIPVIEATGTFSFYIHNQSDQFVDIRLPDKTRIQPPGQDDKLAVNLIRSSTTRYLTLGPIKQ